MNALNKTRVVGKALLFFIHCIAVFIVTGSQVTQWIFGGDRQSEAPYDADNIFSRSFEYMVDERC